MANRDVHIPAGILAPWLVLIFYMLLGNVIPSAFHLYPWILVAILMSLFSFLGERIPDNLEPPTSPRHRGIIHWLGFFAIVYVGWFFITAPNLPLTSINYEWLLGLLIVSFLSGYSSHFILDYIITD